MYIALILFSTKRFRSDLELLDEDKLTFQINEFCIKEK